MSEELKKAVMVTDKKAQYDERAKWLLGQKIILAHILVKAVAEFKNMNPKDVVPYIEGEPYIGTVPIEPSLTNEEGSHHESAKVVGLNTENAEINEGLVRFDIVFYVRMQNGLSQIIVNIEIQKDNPTAYKILNRAVFYVSRLISSQKERDFEKSNYDDIKQVYSIWVCMNMKENCMNYIHLANECLLGSCHWSGNLDIFNIIMIGLAEKIPENSEQYELHRLLGVLLSKKLSIEEKLNIIENEYDISVKENFREGVNEMCNLSQGILEEGIAIGEARGEARGKAEAYMDMVRSGLLDSALAAGRLGMTVEEFEQRMEENVEV